MSTRDAVLNLLSDGQCHSGVALGARLGVTRAAVAKAVATLNASGIDIARVRGRGYRLPQALSLLDIARVRAELPTAYRNLNIEIHTALASTSSALLARADDASIHRSVCLAETQTAGRGRRGRYWVASAYRDLMLSLAWRFEFGSNALAGLSLAFGVAVVDVLRAGGVSDVGLKWPNDILWRGKKLAGLLVDVRTESAGPCLAVVGLGVNIALTPRDARAIDQPYIDLQTIAREYDAVTLDRNCWAARFAAALAQACERYAQTGFSGFIDEWHRYHLYRGRHVGIHQGAEVVVTGTAVGVDDTGALRIRRDDGREQKFHAGEVSLRLAPAGQTAQ